MQYESSYNGSAIYELKVNEDTITLINNHLESNKLTKEDKVVYEEMLKDPNAHKVKSGTRHLVGKLAEASAIRSKQADVIAAEIANPAIRISLYVATLMTPLSPTRTGLLQKIWTMPSPNPDKDWASLTIRINSISG